MTSFFLETYSSSESLGGSITLTTRAGLEEREVSLVSSSLSNIESNHSNHDGNEGSIVVELLPAVENNREIKLATGCHDHHHDGYNDHHSLLWKTMENQEKNKKKSEN